MTPLIVAAVIVGLDQISKHIVSNLMSLGESQAVINNIFHITLVHNTGIAFGLFKNQIIVLIGISIFAIVLILYNLLRQKKCETLHRLELFALSLILGGAIGNLIDRIRFGYVVDFLDFRIWPVFNIADSAITIGIILILIRCIPSFAK